MTKIGNRNLNLKKKANLLFADWLLLAALTRFYARQNIMKAGDKTIVLQGVSCKFYQTRIGLFTLQHKFYPMKVRILLSLMDDIGYDYMVQFINHILLYRCYVIV